MAHGIYELGLIKLLSQTSFWERLSSFANLKLHNYGDCQSIPLQSCTTDTYSLIATNFAGATPWWEPYQGSLPGIKAKQESILALQMRHCQQPTLGGIKPHLILFPFLVIEGYKLNHMISILSNRYSQVNAYT